MRSHAKASSAGPTSGSSALSHPRLVLAGALAVLAVALTAALASAAPAPLSFSPIDGSSTGVSFTKPSGVAIDEVLNPGNVLLSDSSADAVDVFGPEGEVPPGVVSPYRLTGIGFSSEPSGVAIDNSSSASEGDLYAAATGSHEVVKYKLNGSEEYELVKSLSATPAFGEVLGVAVDPSSGNVWVADYNNGLYELSPAGTQIERITATTHPSSVAVDSAGDLFVQQYESGTVFKYAANGSGQVEASATPTQIAASGATGVAVDTGFDTLVVAMGNHVVEYDAISGAEGIEFGSGTLSETERLAVNSQTHDVYVADKGNGEIDAFGPLAPSPIATTNPATTIHHTSAVLNGHLDPKSDPGITNCQFEWGTTTAYAGGTVPCNEGDSFAAPTSVTANLGNLTPGTEIHFRLDIATTSNGDVHGEDRSFTPSPLPTAPPVELAAFGADGTSGTSFSANDQLAFDQANRRLYVLDKGSPSGIFGFDASAPISYPPLAGFSPLAVAPAGNFDNGLAVDNTALGSAGNIYYVSENFAGGTGLVYGFSSAGAALGGNFPIDPAVTPGEPNGSPKDICGAAVDLSGNVWVPNFETKKVLEYSSAGVYQASVDVSAQLNPCRLAFDSEDNLYASQVGTWKFTAASGYTAAIKVDNANAVASAVDLSNNHLYIDHESDISEYDAAGGLVRQFATGFRSKGLAVDEANHDVYVSDRDNHKVRVFGPGAPIEAPTVTPQAATAVTDSSATLNAKVDPETFPVTDCHFEYLTDAAFQTNSPGERFAGAATAPCVPNPGSGSGDVAVSAAISGLNTATTYRFRIVASNANPGGTSTGPEQSFTTLGPKLISQSVEDVSFSDATLSARINPAGSATTYRVEYGTTAAYGQSTPESLPIGFQGDETVHTVSVHIGGLSPATTYHFRFVATNAGGSTVGHDTSFATYSPPPTFGPCANDTLRSGIGARLPDCRAYEQATPIDKHGADAQGTVGNVQASRAGDRVIFYSIGGLPTTGGSSIFAPFMASRGPGGWSSDGLLPPTLPDGQAAVTGWDEDLSVAFAVAPGPANVDRVFYLRDSASGTFHQSGPVQNSDYGFSLAGVAADTSHLIFGSNSVLLPEAVPSKENLYDLDHGTLTLAGRIPAGSATTCDDGGGPACVVPPEGSVAGPYDWDRSSQGGYYRQNTLSEDGSKVFFTALGTDQLYVREDATATARISASQRTTLDPNGEKPAAFLAATPDGSKVFFASCEKLTDDSTAVSTADNTCTSTSQGQDIYSYDTGSGQLTDLTVDSNVGDSKGADVLGIVGISRDGAYVYFAANGVLAPGAAPGNCEIGHDSAGPSCNLYVLHNGATTFIAQLDGADRQDWAGGGHVTGGGQKDSRVSVDGHSLLFSSIESPTGYDSTSPPGNHCDFSSCAELFRYSAPEGELTCVSCSPTGAAPTGEAVLGTGRGGLTFGLGFRFLTRNFSADGKRVFFDSTDALLPSDINGVTDVYEWEAQGSGSCQSAGGCLYLISSGTSPDPSYFSDASANGDHVFIFTSQQLVPGDRDQLVDVYDAAVGGGLPSQHSLAPPTCSSTACQANPAPPPEQTPASAAFSGPGNAHAHPVARRCAKGTRKVRRAGKVHCQKKSKPRKHHINRGGSK